MLGRFAWVSKNANKRWKQLLKTIVGKRLRIILTLARIQMLLVDAVEMMAELVHKDVQKHECSGLCFREPTCDQIFGTVIGNAKSLENLLV